MKLLQSLLCLLLMGMAVTAYAVDQDVQVDLLMAKITSALKADRAAEALPSFAQLESMEPSLKTPLPESFYFYYIDTLDKAGDKEKALGSDHNQAFLNDKLNANSRAEAYLEKHGKKGKYYSQVIEIKSRLGEELRNDLKIKMELLKQVLARRNDYETAYAGWQKNVEACEKELRGEQARRMTTVMYYSNKSDYGEKFRAAQEQAAIPTNKLLNNYCEKKYPEPKEPD